jgi:hypothetical protein
MELRARIRHFARPAAMTAALGALLVPALAGPATADAAKRKKSKRYPVVTSVSPMDVKVGDTITIRGRNFKRGKNKNTVVFKRDGARAVFVKSTLGTARQIRVVVPETLREFVAETSSARFRLRVLSERFSKRFTSTSKSPLITAPAKPAGSTPGAPAAPGAPGAPGAPAAPGTPAPEAPRNCTGDEDGDLLDAATENNLGLNPCLLDSDDDGVADGYELQSARDLNDDEYQNVNDHLPYPGKRPYPNPLFKDSDVDYDGDSLTLAEEYRLWKVFGSPALENLLYSDGNTYSLSARDGGTGRRRPTQAVAGYPKHADFQAWASSHGYQPVFLSVAAPWHAAANQQPFDLLDFNRSGAVDTGVRVAYLDSEREYFDFDADGFVSDDERDEDADGLTNYDEAHGRTTAAYWKGCYAREKPYDVLYAGTDLTVADTDGDGVRDGADDQDHDDIPNVMELSRNAASGHSDWDPHKGQCVPNDLLLEADGSDEGADPDAPKVLHPTDYGRVNPYNPCLPFTWSRTCDRHPGLESAPAPFDGSTNWFSLQ